MYFADITAPRRTEEALNEHSAIVEFAQDALISICPNGNVRSWNPGAERLFGYPAVYAIRQPVSKIAEGPAQQAQRGLRVGRAPGVHGQGVLLVLDPGAGGRGRAGEHTGQRGPGRVGRGERFESRQPQSRPDLRHRPRRHVGHSRHRRQIARSRRQFPGASLREVVQGL